MWEKGRRQEQPSPQKGDTWSSLPFEFDSYEILTHCGLIIEDKFAKIVLRRPISGLLYLRRCHGDTNIKYSL